MIVKNFAWPLDPHASSVDNYIKGERHVITAANGSSYRVIMPRGAPFFVKDLKVTFVPMNRVLQENIDYALGYQFELISRRTYMPVFCGIVILDHSLSGTFEIEYRTLGGEFTLEQQSLATLLSNAITDPRTTSWEALTEVPWYFTPIEHRFDVQDMVGMSGVVAAVDRIANALASRETENALLLEHIQETLNPHATTKEQVGLGLVPNCRMANESEALAMTRTDLFLSPAHMAIVLSRLSSETVAGHASDRNNPHFVTKAQVGLPNVDNFPTANDTQAIDINNNNTFMTPRKVWLMISTRVLAAINGHIAATGNVHGLTKDDLGLDRVANIGKATTTELDNPANLDTHYPTIAGVVRIFNRILGNAFTAHVGARNPHGTTKGDIGLSEVPNYSIAGAAEALANSSEHFSTPMSTYLQIQAFGGVAEVENMVNVTDSFTTDHLNKYLRIAQPSDGTYFVGPDASSNWPDHATLNLRVAGPGILTLAGSGGVTLHAPSGGSLRLAPGMAVTLKRVATDTWDVIGQTISTGSTGGGTGGGTEIPVEPLTHLTWNITAAYAGLYLRVTTTDNALYTVDNDVSGSWTGNAEVIIRKQGPGILTLAAAYGVTLNPPADGSLQLGEGMVVSLKRVAANTWDIAGYTVAP